MADAASRLKGILEQLLGAPLPVRVRTWDGSEAGPPEAPVLVVRNRRALRRLLADKEDTAAVFELMRALEEPGRALVFDAPIDLILSPHQVLQPDLAIIRSERQALVTERGIEGPPDIIVEVLSPSTRLLDQRVKKGLYARFAVPEYWMVDPVGGQIELYRLEPGADFEIERRFDRTSWLTTSSFPELNVELARVFRG